MESELMLTPSEKFPLPEALRRMEPTTLNQAGQRAQHTTNRAIPAPELGLNPLSPRSFLLQLSQTSDRVSGTLLATLPGVWR